MEFIYKTLNSFGLNNKEVDVYLACLKDDVTSPYKLAKLTGIPRTTIYDILLNLSLKRLVVLEQSDGFTKQQTKVRANNPSTLRKILQEKRKDLTRLELDVVDILPNLKEDFHKKKSNSNFKFYPGVEGLKQIYFDRSLETVDEQIYTWDLLMPMDMIGREKMNEITDDINSLHLHKSYPPKEIVALNDWTKHVLTYQYGRDPNYVKSREIRYVDNPTFGLSVEINIVGTIVRIACSREDENWGLSINSMALSETLKSIFLVEWSRAIPITEELIKSWGTNDMLNYELEGKSIKE